MVTAEEAHMTLYVREAGPANAPSILFLHGGGAGGWMWRTHVTLLGDYHCLVPDLPEHGESVAEMPFSIMDAAGRMAELVRTRAHGGRAHLAGLSLGAQVALQLLSTSPELVDHAMLSGTLVRPMKSAGWANATARLYMPFKDWKWLIRMNMRSLGIPEDYLDEVRSDTQRLTADAYARITAENMRFALPDGLDRVTVPTLIAAGSLEPAPILASAQDLAHAIPKSMECVLPRRGHNWPLQLPTLFVQTLLAWIHDEPLPREWSH